MQNTMATNKALIYALVGIAILAFFALAAELLPEVEAKMIVIPTLILLIGWSLLFLTSFNSSR